MTSRIGHSIHALVLPAFIFLAGTAAATVAEAASDSPSQSTSDNAQQAEILTSLLDHYYLSLSATDFEAADNSGQMDVSDNRYGYGANFGWVFNRYLALDTGLMWFSADYERNGAVIPGTTNNNLRINTYGIDLNLRLSYPLKRFTTFLSAGRGYYNSDMWTVRPGDRGFTLEGPPSSESGAGSSFGLGIGIPLGNKSWLDFSWRYLKLDLNFGEYSQGRIDAGGDLFSITFRAGGF
ncbi:outer membrane beta-barrel protein [Halioxenophilus sp. WMMB6]|uniref:outer membrane beta-barrel protein n=1 Tax=Halioxenophilus sp. WMMB6 TaxID=3073815 RepID=UPI00295F41D7|nr:outer membrane beta-barrel protein [Halioxenophilus sp. WMMB6]